MDWKRNLKKYISFIRCFIAITLPLDFKMIIMHVYLFYFIFKKSLKAIAYIRKFFPLTPHFLFSRNYLKSRDIFEIDSFFTIFRGR